MLVLKTKTKKSKRKRNNSQENNSTVIILINFYCKKLGVSNGGDFKEKFQN